MAHEGKVAAGLLLAYAAVGIGGWMLAKRTGTGGGGGGTGGTPGTIPPTGTGGPPPPPPPPPPTTGGGNPPPPPPPPTTGGTGFVLCAPPALPPGPNGCPPGTYPTIDGCCQPIQPSSPPPLCDCSAFPPGTLCVPKPGPEFPCLPGFTLIGGCCVQTPRPPML